MFHFPSPLVVRISGRLIKTCGWSVYCCVMSPHRFCSSDYTRTLLILDAVSRKCGRSTANGNVSEWTKCRHVPWFFRFTPTHRQSIFSSSLVLVSSLGQATLQILCHINFIPNWVDLLPFFSLYVFFFSRPLSSFIVCRLLFSTICCPELSLLSLWKTHWIYFASVNKRVG